MNKVGLTEKIIIALFIVTTIFVLWLISPMGKAYLPISTKPLENSLHFKLPKDFTIKYSETKNTSEIYHLYYNKQSPHLISLLIFNNKKLQIPDVNPLNTQDGEIRNFWGATRFSDYKILDCKDIKNKKDIYTMCNFECSWPASHHKALKEGQFALLNINNKSVFIVCTASRMAFDSGVISKLINSIIKKS